MHRYVTIVLAFCATLLFCSTFANAERLTSFQLLLPFVQTDSVIYPFSFDNPNSVGPFNYNDPERPVEPVYGIVSGELVQVPGAGLASDYAGIDVNGKIAVVSRGNITYGAKANIAADNGATAIVLYGNPLDGVLSPTIIEQTRIPGVFISRSYALEIFDAAQTAGVTPLGIVTDVNIIPEPTSLACLGMGGVLLLRRRRTI